MFNIYYYIKKASFQEVLPDSAGLLFFCGLIIETASEKRNEGPGAMKNEKIFLAHDFSIYFYVTLSTNSIPNRRHCVKADVFRCKLKYT